MLRNWLDRFTRELSEVIGLFAIRIGAWIAPIAPAAAIHDAAVTDLGHGEIVAWAMALTVEFAGIATLHNALKHWEWDKIKRVSEPTFPRALTVSLVALYVITAMLLTVFVDIFPGVEIMVWPLFYMLAIAAVTSVAVNNQLGQWSNAHLSTKKADKKARQQDKAIGQLKADNDQLRGQLAKALANLDKAKRTQASVIVQPIVPTEGDLDKANMAKQVDTDRLKDIAFGRLKAGDTAADIAADIGRSERTVRRWKTEFNGKLASIEG